MSASTTTDCAAVVTLPSSLEIKTGSEITSPQCPVQWYPCSVDRWNCSCHHQQYEGRKEGKKKEKQHIFMSMVQRWKLHLHKILLFLCWPDAQRFRYNENFWKEGKIVSHTYFLKFFSLFWSVFILFVLMESYPSKICSSSHLSDLDDKTIE